MGNLSLKKFTQFALVLALVYLGVSYLPDILGFGGSILDAASPLIWGCVIAYVLNILMVGWRHFIFPNPIVKLYKRVAGWFVFCWPL